MSTKNLETEKQRVNKTAQIELSKYIQILSLIYQILSKSKLRSMSKISINKTTTTYLLIEIGIQSAVSQIVFDFILPLS